MAEVGLPRFKHDCPVLGLTEGWADENCCRFLGRHGKFDLYIHVREGTEHFPDYAESIARHGDDGPEYLSGPSVARMIGEFLSE